MNTTHLFPASRLMLGLVFAIPSFAVAADANSAAFQAAVDELPAAVKTEKANKFFAVTGLVSKGSPESKKAATQFTKTLVTYTSEFKENKITGAELATNIEKSFTAFVLDARLVLLKVPTMPADCTVQWKPVLLGEWADVNAQGSWVGFGKTKIRVTKAGFKPKELTIDTKQNPTEQPVTLELEK